MNMRVAQRLFVALFLCGVATAVVVDVPGYGSVMGVQWKSYLEDNEFYGFMGLRYAKEPTAETRFLPPVPVDPLPEGEIFNATFYDKQCPQGLDGDEDCLLVNIFTRELPNGTDPNLPVMVWIHGGGYSTGGSLPYQPFAFMDQNVVLVIMQYRLGPLGFLTLNTDDIPGNAGLYDQVEALRWIQKNIRAFGGNPDQVTVFGESAGGASVGLLMLFPQARGLFHRVISESGSALTPWAVDYNAVRHTYNISELAGCPTSPEMDLVACLRTVDQHVLSNAYQQYMHDDRFQGGIGFGGSSAVLQVAGVDPLITVDPWTQLSNGDYDTSVPILFGCNKHEGTFVLGTIYNEYAIPNNILNNTEFLSREFIYVLVKAITGERPSDAIVDAIIEKYFVGAELGNFESMMPGLVDVTGTLFLKNGTYETVVRHSRFNPDTYLYAFNYEGRASLMSFLVGDIPAIPHGVSHSDELIYLYQFTPLFNETERYMTQRMIQMWTNFATYGDPTPEGLTLPDIPKWEKFSVDNGGLYLDIDNEITLKPNYPATFTVANDQCFGCDRSASARVAEETADVDEMQGGIIAAGVIGGCALVALVAFVVVGVVRKRVAKKKVERIEFDNLGFY